MSPPAGSPFWTGGFLALLAALAFGAVTPFVQRWGLGLGPFTTAALLYGGAAASSIGWRSEREAPLRAKHTPRLLAVALAGAVLGPAALAWGLQRTGSTAASLLLNFEAVFTVLLARAFYREPIGPRAGTALVLMTAGGAWLVLGSASSPVGSRAGLAAVGVATLCWAVDNTVTRPLSDLDPAGVVRWKSLLGACVSLVIARSLREPPPRAEQALSLLACGAFGYGVSLRLYLLAQRKIGAGRTGSVFAAAPFMGALVAWALGDRTATRELFGVAALFAAGVALHLTEEHGHAHTHAPLDHEHAHTHVDGHHDHPHDAPVPHEHSHPHHHDSRAHDHPHSPDAHHRHEHH